MKISVLGCGRWGTFIAWYLNKLGHNVLLYGREGSANMFQLQNTHSNGVIQLNDEVELVTNLQYALEAEIIVISINSQGLRTLLEEMKNYMLDNKYFVLCMKGIEILTTKRLTEVLSEYVKDVSSIAVWLGPGHPEEFYKGIPNCMVIDSENVNTKEMLIREFSSKLIRFYLGTDLIGNEIGAAAKNVIGIGAGMLDGLGLSSLKGALMSRGTMEISRLIVALGGNRYSAYGLCHLGDYAATVFSEYSHNRQFGEAFVKGNRFEKLAEGYHTAKALYDLGIEKKIDLPICNAIYEILYQSQSPADMIDQLFEREIKKEFLTTN